jgi:hypothetical protein
MGGAMGSEEGITVRLRVGGNRGEERDYPHISDIGLDF